MLNKFLNVHKLSAFSSRGRPKPVAQPLKELGENAQEASSSTLKIVHAGGAVECYYMAIPAVNIIKKHPALILARPQVFRRPWDSLVRSDEILTPGQKFYLVPRNTVRKLRRRIKKPNGDRVSVSSFASQMSSIDLSKDDFSSKSFLQRNEASDRSSDVSGLFRTRRNKNGKKKKNVTFAGIDDAKQKDEAIAESANKKSDHESQAGKRKWRNGVLWQPSLTAISERHGPGE